MASKKNQPRLDTDRWPSHWDFCIIGNGVAALWMAHHAWRTKRSVLWIGSDDAYTSARSLCSHAWHWGLSESTANAFRELMSLEKETPNFELAYYDARSSKRFRSLSEVKLEWGEHEVAYFESLLPTEPAMDLWSWNNQIQGFHSTSELPSGPSTVELFSDPVFVRLHRWPVQAMETKDGRLMRVAIGGGDLEPVWVSASRFVLTDYDENFASLVQDSNDAEVLAGASKGRTIRPGFGLRLRHKNYSNPLSQTVIIPLTVSPEKGKASHVVGRFVEGAQGLESVWFGFLTDEEVEDNNEILKKIKHAKRAIDRALPGFLDSIEREAVTFEPRMFAKEFARDSGRSKEILSGKAKQGSSENSAAKPVLGAWLLSDQFGLEPLVKGFLKCLAPDVSERTHVENSLPNTLEVPSP